MIGKARNVVKAWVQRLPLTLFFPIYRLWSWIETGIGASILRRRLGLVPLSDLDVENATRSDMVFILGSGYSINHITPQRWNVIKAHDTIALNNWLVHPFVPTFYCFESAAPEPGDDGVACNFLLNNICARASDYRSTIKIVSNLKHYAIHQIAHDLPRQWHENLYFAATPVVVARTRAEFVAMVRYYKTRGLFTPDSKINSLFRYNSVLITCISFAIRAGYRRIVLCGVDLRSSSYFYQNPQAFPETAAVTLRPREEKHDTVVAKPWLVPIDEELMILREEILNPAGIELFVESTDSLLYPRIPAPPESLFQSDTSEMIKPNRS